jgi:hypothetical protein
MKLNEEQLADLQQELNYAVQYKETYDELYDHILTEIDTYDEQPLYSTTVAKQIIDDEFGGYEALKQTEKDRVKLVNAAMRKKHWQNMMAFFNFPMAALTIVATIAAYFVAVNPHGSRMLLLFTTFSAIAPMLFVLYKRLSKKILEWHADIYTKQSLKEDYILIAAFIANSMFNLLNAFSQKIQLNAGLTMFVFVFYMVYVLSFFKLYRQEFKMQLT